MVATTDDDTLPSDYKPYIPVAKRRAQLRSQLGSKKRVKVIDEVEQVEQAREVEEEEERAREKLRRERTLLQAAQEVKEQRAIDGESSQWSER